MIHMLALVAVLCHSPVSGVQDPTQKPAEIRTPHFVADVSAAPEMQPWGHTAEALCEDWYSKVSAMLKSDESTEDRSVSEASVPGSWT